MADPSDLRTLEIVLTAGCNLRCSYCYQNAKQARRMEWETLRAALDLILRSPSEAVDLLFIGGEPLLEFRSIQQAVAYVEDRRRRDLGVHYEVITNGMLLTDEHVRFFTLHDFDVQLSFDGVPDAQALRGKGTYQVLDRLLDRLRDEHSAFFRHRLRISITLLPQTIHVLPESVRYFLQKGVQTIAIAPAITHQPEWRTRRIDELDEVFQRVFDLSVDHFRRTGELPLVAFRKSPGRSAASREPVSMCDVASGRKAAVDVDGEVLGCVTFAPSYQVFPTTFLRSRLEALRMGGVEESELDSRRATYPAAARATGLFTDKQDKYSSYGPCGECRFLDSCSICPVSIGHQPGNTDPRRVPDFLCAYNLVSLKYRDLFPVAAAPDVLTRLSEVQGLVRNIDALLPGTRGVAMVSGGQT